DARCRSGVLCSRYGHTDLFYPVAKCRIHALSRKRRLWQASAPPPSAFSYTLCLRSLSPFREVPFFEAVEPLSDPDDDRIRQCAGNPHDSFLRKEGRGTGADSPLMAKQRGSLLAIRPSIQQR